jgi:hypothetical protein
MFSTTLRRDTNYGFVGLGKMGYPMAQNLRTKLPKDDTLFIYDINKAATEQFRKEMGAGVEVSSGVEEVVEHSVSSARSICPMPSREGKGVLMMNVIFSHNPMKGSKLSSSDGITLFMILFFTQANPLIRTTFLSLLLH